MVKPFVFPYRPFPGAGISITRFPLRTQQSIFVLGCSPIVTMEECYIAQGAVNQSGGDAIHYDVEEEKRSNDGKLSRPSQDVPASGMLPHKFIISITRI
jgi:hypothetical protein